MARASAGHTTESAASHRVTLSEAIRGGAERGDAEGLHFEASAELAYALGLERGVAFEVAGGLGDVTPAENFEPRAIAEKRGSAVLIRQTVCSLSRRR